jgi:L-ascorbate metabolism protein UlaG (beta-lactamase superfamily)
MELTKHAHACVTLQKGTGRIVIDPGAFTPDAEDLVAGAAAVLITHEHFDHFDEGVIAAALQSRPELTIYGPAAVVDRWEGTPGQVNAVVAGDRFTVAGFDVAVFGDLHAVVHRDIPRVANVGFLVDDTVYHPGDAYHSPPARVTTLLLPTSGPWTKLADAVDFVRAVAPERVVQIHELMLSELGQQSMAMFLSPDMLSTVPLTILPVGETITV